MPIHSFTSDPKKVAAGQVLPLASAGVKSFWGWRVMWVESILKFDLQLLGHCKSVYKNLITEHV